MDTLALVFIGILPTIIVAFLTYQFDFTQSKIAAKNAVLAYMFGVALAVPAYYYEMQFEMYDFFLLNNPWQAFLAALLGIALIEEALKGIGLYISAQMNLIDERLDILMLSILVSMGFAGIENILYSQDFGWEVALFRAVTSVPAHYVFACIMAYFIAMDFDPKNKSRIAPWGYGVPVAILFHSLYDYFIIQDFSEYMMLGSIIILVLGLIISYLVFRRLRQVNNF